MYIGKAIQERSSFPSESTEIRKSRRHGRFNLLKRRVSVAQSKAALLLETDLRKYHFRQY